MRFKEWIYNEILHMSIPTQSINGIMADGIDFRFEDWSKGSAKGRLMPHPKAFIQGSFSAPIEKGFLNIDQGGGQTSGSSALQVATVPLVSTEAAFELLPDGWFDFAALYLRNRLVKPPAWPRDDFERGLKSVDVISP